VGLEPSPALAALASRWGFTVHNCFLEEMPVAEHGSFDAVALSDVFEHVTDPIPFLKAARVLLKPAGVLYVKVPNARWSLFKQRALTTMGRRPAKGIWDSYEHVVHYTEESLRRMLANGGLTVLHVATEPPIQTPNWHEHVGHYYQYPTPWPLDWRRKTVRTVFYWLAFVERALRLGRLGYFAQNVVAVARKASTEAWQ
jgi:SAM-dependent methyltransferase